MRIIIVVILVFYSIGQFVSSIWKENCRQFQVRGELIIYIFMLVNTQFQTYSFVVVIQIHHKYASNKTIVLCKSDEDG